MTKISLIGAALCSCALLAGCGAGGYATKPAAATSADTAVKIVEMTDSTFAPSAVRVKVGETVSFVDKDEIAHTATAEKSFDSGTLREGERFVFKATEPGTIGYVCIFHPGMTGTIDVSN
ncbi:cupredoxin domain-containing protein [Solirubrobacter ginsenosidimutans]|uniref:Cupredoxin domain-containing protein n=1 Tax=Solirubrobacter ginsenosidimutans TaxID=490573 RepID=A0A9X3N2N0_9ACTN|nr:plastocyanin/azurin family copper-binding protein [Solirubrobacter ginsenosidimutans]MDA0163703.1 cupredoxin domain-containing protein [Solirubrobacter ginsenosidimutans]